MRRWDALVERYLEEYVTAGRSEETIRLIRQELGRCGLWLKSRRPRPLLSEVVSELLIPYLQSRSVFHSKSTLSGVMSKLRGWACAIGRC